MLPVDCTVGVLSSALPVTQAFVVSVVPFGLLPKNFSDAGENKIFGMRSAGFGFLSCLTSSKPSAVKCPGPSALNAV